MEIYTLFTDYTVWLNFIKISILQYIHTYTHIYIYIHCYLNYNPRDSLNIQIDKTSKVYGNAKKLEYKISEESEQK